MNEDESKIINDQTAASEADKETAGEAGGQPAENQTAGDTAAETVQQPAEDTGAEPAAEEAYGATAAGGAEALMDAANGGGKGPVKKESAKSVAFEWIKDILIAIIIAAVVIQFVKPTIVKEQSMEPNFYANDYLFVSKQSYRTDGPQRGDVIVFKSDLLTESGEKKLLIKRVIGLPGETIDVKDGDVYVDGKAIDQSFTKDGWTNGDIEGLVVPKGEYFCMGDNRLVSIDSRDPSVGCVEKSRIVGKVVFRLYPFSKIGTIKNPLK